MLAHLFPALGVWIFVVLTGHLLLHAWHFRWQAAPPWLGWCMIVGSAILALVTAALSYLELARPLFIVPICLGGAFAFAWLKRKGDWQPGGPITGGWLYFLPSLLVVLFSLWLSLQRPTWNVDAQMRWVMHGQWLADTGTVVPFRIRENSWADTHPSYPPLVPAFIGLALQLGADRDWGVRPLFPFYLLGLLGILFGFLGRRCSLKVGACLTFAFALTPCLSYLPRYEGTTGLGADAAVADVALALYLTALAIALLECLRPQTPAFLIKLAVAAAFASVWTKNEGMAFVPLMLAATSLWFLCAGDVKRLLFTIQTLCLSIGAIAIWKMKSVIMPVAPGEDYLNADAFVTLSNNTDRLGGILSRLFTEFGAWHIWGFLHLVPFVWILGLFLFGRRPAWSSYLLPFLWWLLSVMIIVAAYLVTGWKEGNYELLMDVSLTRLLIHHCPLLLIMLGLTLEHWRQDRAQVAAD